MFFRPVRIGRLLGFDIELSTSFLILLGLVLIFQGLVTGLVLAVFVFGSVVLHELGHSVVARRLGVPIAGIELHFFGGVAKMLGMPNSARDEVLIAAAGPAVSLALGLGGLALHAATGLAVFLLIGNINLILGIFNLLPALPMDGGRILRALLARRMGRLQATYLAVRVAHVLALVMGLAGLLLGHWQVALVALVVYLMASQEKLMAPLWSYGDEGRTPTGPADWQTELLDRDGTPLGWFDAEGRPVPGAPHAAARRPVRERRVFRTPDGGYIVVERIRW